MQSPLIAAGAVTEPSKYAPLHVNRMFTGLWTQRNPLREAAVPHLYEKFYSAARFDSLIDGLNTEVTARLTMARRPGNSVYNSQTFPAIKRFYNFKTFTPAGEVIKVMADTATDVFDATGPSTKTSILTKAAGAGRTEFLGVGNLLYMGDGVEQKKWAPYGSGNIAKAWAAATAFNVGDFITDSNLNLQKVADTRWCVLFQQAANVVIVSNVLTIFIAPGITQDQLNQLPGSTLRFEECNGTAGFLNGQSITVTSATLAAVGVGQITGTFNHADYTGNIIAGFIYSSLGFTSANSSNISGNSQPTWNAARGGITSDGNFALETIHWQNMGPTVRNWGIAAPTAAPTVALANLSSPYPAWAATKFYSPSLLVLDNAGTPHLWKLTTDGTTSASATWQNIDGAGHSNGGVAGTEVWADQGQAAWQANHAYSLGQYVAVAFSRTVKRRRRDPETREVEIIEIVTNYYDLFKCAIAGTSGNAQPQWSSGVATKVTDGSGNPALTWVNVGTVITGDGRTINSVVTIGIGSSTVVTTVQTIKDNNNNLEQPSTAGKSAASAPTWSTVTGGVTVETSGLTWVNIGPYGKANTAAWTYWFAFRDDLLKEESTLSPASNPIVQGAGQYVALSGDGSGDNQVGVIRIYRTPQGGSTPEFLADVTNPGQGQTWTYADNSDDTALDFTIVGAQNHANDPPPTGMLPQVYYLERIWGVVGNTVWYTAGPSATVGSGNDQVPPNNKFVFPSTVIRLHPTTIGLLVFTTRDIHIVRGTTPLSFFSQKFLDSYGLANFDAFAVGGSTIYFYTNAKKLVSIDAGAGVIEPGFPIGDKAHLGGYDPTTAIMTWHEGASGDTALFACDGAVGWYRMAPNAAPESGLVWSPQAQIVGGTSAVGSIETAPGVMSLLVGPASSGPILKRDDTVNKDNTSTFSAYYTVGSVVLAQAPSVAEIEMFTIDAVKVGTRPTLGVLTNEIGGNFDTLYWTKTDPPLLPPSDTLFGLRYSMDQAQNTAFCRHLQMKVAFAAEDAHNEILAYSIFGAVHQEKR